MQIRTHVLPADTATAPRRWRLREREGVYCAADGVTGEAYDSETAPPFDRACPVPVGTYGVVKHRWGIGPDDQAAPLGPSLEVVFFWTAAPRPGGRRGREIVCYATITDEAQLRGTGQLAV